MTMHYNSGFALFFLGGEGSIAILPPPPQKYRFYISGGFEKSYKILKPLPLNTENAPNSTSAFGISNINK